MDVTMSCKVGFPTIIILSILTIIILSMKVMNEVIKSSLVKVFVI